LAHFTESNEADSTLKVYPLTKLYLDKLLAKESQSNEKISLTEFEKTWLNSGCVSFKAKGGEVCILPDPSGRPNKALLGIENASDLWSFAALVKHVPQGHVAEIDPAALDLVVSSSEAKKDDFKDPGFTPFPGIPAFKSLSPADAAALGFALGHYSFDRYKKDSAEKSGNGSSSNDDGAETGKPKKPAPKLVWPANCNRSEIVAMARAICWARDLITTPAEDMGPQHLAAEAERMAASLRDGSGVGVGSSSESVGEVKLRILTGDELLREGFRAVHAVGRACYRPPVLIDFQWQPASCSLDPKSSTPSATASKLPLLTLVGKGVCFDSGGLDIKSAGGMKTMKMDMGGAATVLALGYLVASQQLPVRLRVLVPAVENSVSANSYRPLDVIRTKAGITVEVGNTDAEGRLILADALTEALACQVSVEEEEEEGEKKKEEEGEKKKEEEGHTNKEEQKDEQNNNKKKKALKDEVDLLIDVATLTGAARIALGSNIPAVFTNSDPIWHAIEAAAAVTDDPVWRLPLHTPYRQLLRSKVADLSSTSCGEPGYGGSIVAALFLKEFAKGAQRWVHVDTSGYVNSAFSTTGKPEGGEAQGLRSLWEVLKQRYSSK